MMIQAQGISKRFGTRWALSDVSFSVERGETVGFLGPNGAGKSTTLRILTSFLSPTSGVAMIDGHDVWRESMKTRARIGYMPENVPLYNDLRVREYLRFRGRLRGMRGRKLRQNVGKVMERCGLQEKRRAMIGSLSKGLRQRVGLADALLHDPPILILDEPTNGLDPNQIRRARSFIQELGKDHTILLSTHILSEVEMLCDRVIIIDRGQIKAADTPENLTRQLRTAGRLTLEVASLAPAEEFFLEQIAGVKKVEKITLPDEWVRYTLRVEAERDVRHEVYALASQRQWELREIRLEKARLEEVFAELTQPEQGGGSVSS